MKQQVTLSKFCIISTLLCLALFVVCAFIMPGMWEEIAWGVFVVIMLIISLYYMPMSISADENAIYINRSLKIKSISMTEVKSAKLHTPSMSTIRTCGSGGFMGYWGWFRERGIGNYFAYYGQMKDCFLVELKNGHKYLLGCKNAPKMVEYINKQLKK
ncbi:MAG: hypothetical protein IKV32_04580 [Muribaculaceae bacterium]|nr:hypothetical protein [Muribaculaceae bacterium]